jgi:hypothetical protein
VATIFHSETILLILLGGFSLLVIGSSCWQDAWPRAMGWRAVALAFGLLAAIAAGALAMGTITALPFLVPALVGLLAACGVIPANVVRFPGFFAAVVLGLAAAMGIVLLAVPIWVGAPLVAVLGLIMLLNHNLYAFFARKRGLIFAIAVVPFQLLYYFYSVMAFVAATSIYLLKPTIHPEAQDQSATG